jgi:hypothetical protein
MPHASGFRDVRVNARGHWYRSTEAVGAETNRVSKVVARLGWYVQLYPWVCQEQVIIRTTSGVK